MKLSKSSPALYLLLSITISTLFGVAQPAMAQTDTSPEIVTMAQNTNSLSQVRGNLAAVWSDRETLPQSVVMANGNYDVFKDRPSCGCAQCSGIRDALSQVG